MLRECVAIPEVQEGTVRVPVFTLLAPGQQQVPPGGLTSHQLQPQGARRTGCQVKYVAFMVRAANDPYVFTITDKAP